ncbi:MAG: hypothetical protein WDZ41_03775 [Candidatus Babeliales bacterium]
MTKLKTFVEGFSDILVKNNVIETDRAKAIKKLFYDSAKPSFVYFLLEEGLIDREDILNALSEYYRVPAFDVVGHFFDHHLVRKFPKDLLLRNAMIPLEVDENMLIVIASEPDNPDLLSIIGDNVSYDVRFMVGIEPDITDAVKEFYELAVTQVPEDVDIKEEYRDQDEAEDIWLEELEED